MSPVSNTELERQYRVLRQRLSMHAMLRDGYAKRALLLDIVLLACSVIFCATTFSSDDGLAKVGLSAERTRTVLGLASITAFFASLVALRVGWKGRSTLHRDAVQKLTVLLGLFRELRQEDGTWPEGQSTELHKAYWEVNNNVVEVPDRRFVGLKVRYLRKIELSRMSSTSPGCPLFVLWIGLVCRSICTALWYSAKTKRERTDEPNRDGDPKTQADR